MARRDTPTSRPAASRARWVALGAITAVALGAGGVLATGASTGTPSSFVPITPCRLLDTRPGSDNVGPRVGALQGDETWATQTRGSVGRCDVPAEATGLSMNITAINPTSASFLTVFPADAARPTAASLNWVGGQAPTPNAVTSKLGADGQLAFYNLAGAVDLTVDVVGYYVVAGGPNASDDIQQVEQSQASLANKVTGLGNSVTSLAGSVTSLAGSVTSLATRVSVLEGRPTPGDEIIATEVSMPGTVAAQLTANVGSVTTTTAGRWLLSGSWNLSATCSSGTTYLAFLLVDDVPVRSTVVNRTGATAAPTTLTGTTAASIAAGAHTVKLGVMCPSPANATAIGGLPSTGVTNVVVLH